jgi:hypothetical protein
MNVCAPAEEAGYLSPQEISADYGCDQGTVYNWIALGVPVGGQRVRLHALRVGKLWRVPRASWEAFLAACNPGPPPPAPRRRRKAGADPDREALHRELGITGAGG